MFAILKMDSLIMCPQCKASNQPHPCLLLHNFQGEALALVYTAIILFVATIYIGKTFYDLCSQYSSWGLP